MKELISKEQALEAYRRGETVYYDNHNRGRYYATEEEFMAADLDNHFGGDWLYALEFHLLPSDWPPTEEELAQRPGKRGFKFVDPPPEENRSRAIRRITEHLDKLSNDDVDAFYELVLRRVHHGQRPNNPLNRKVMDAWEKGYLSESDLEHLMNRHQA